MLRKPLLVALLGACSFTHGGFGGGGGGDGGSIDTPTGMTDGSIDAPGPPLRQKAITVNPVVIGVHMNFPMWITLTDTDLAARARADGQDIHFTASDGSPLAFEIQHWTKATGRLDAWVRVPTLASGAALLVRYGDVTLAHAASPSTVFGAYSAVWHLEDTLNTTAIVDARGAVPGAAANLIPADQIAAKLGGGINFTNSTEQVTFTNPLAGTTPHTISLWVNQRTTTDNDAMIVLGNGAGNQARWFHSRFNSATIAVGFYGNDYTTATHDVQGDGWALLHWVFEGSNRMSRLYRDGTLVAGPFQHGTGINTQGAAGYLGNAPTAFGTNMGLTATIDEVRIINVARGVDWIAAEALNQAVPPTFYTVSTQQMP